MPLEYAGSTSPRQSPGSARESVSVSDSKGGILLALVKFRSEQRLDGVERSFRLRPVRLDLYRGTHSRAQHHEVHQRARVSFFFLAAHHDRGVVVSQRKFGQLARSARVQAANIDHRN